MELTERQKEIRRTRITASSISSFLGYDPYRSPLQAWEQHVGLTEFQPNDDTEGGHDFEVAIAAAGQRVADREGFGLEWASRQRPRELVNSYDPSDDTLVSPLKPWLCATPDFYCKLEGISAIQVKNQRPHMTKAYKGKPTGGWDNELVPPHYLMQCQTEMIVLSDFTGKLQLCVYLCVHFGGPLPRIYKIRRDEELQAGLCDEGFKFWQKHIDPDGPMTPPVSAPWIVGPERKSKPTTKITGKALLHAPLPNFSAPASDLLGGLPKFSGEKE